MPLPLSVKRGMEKRPPGKKWGEMSEQEKIAFIESIGEIAGGTAGALAGGGTPLSIPGAGAGAVAGKNLANMAARAAGLNQAPRTGTEELLAQAEAFALNATGEGAGRVVPGVARAAKRGAENLRAAFLAPDAERQILVDLADKYNIPLNIAQRSGSSVLALLQGALDRLPFASPVMRQTYKAQYGKWLDGMNSVLDQVHRGSVTQEQFAEIAENAIKQLRGNLNKTTTEAVEAAAAKLHPTPVSKQSAGAAAKEKLGENQNTVREWAKRTYGAIRDEGKGVNVDLTPMSEQATEVLQTFPDMPLQGSVFDPSAMGKLRSAASLTSKGGDVETLDALAKSMGADSFAALNPRLQDAVRQQAAGEAKQGATVTLEQALNTRSRLLNLARGMNDAASAEKKRAVYSLIDGLDNSLEQSLAATPETAALHKRLKDANIVYRQKMEALRPPQTYGKPGNEAAGRITQTKLPEDIPTQLADSPTLSQGSQTALSNDIVADIGTPAGPPALPMLRRSLMDDAAQRAIVDTGTGDTRMSPTRVYSNLKRYGADLLGSPVPRPVTPQMIGREGLIHNSNISRAIDSGASDRVLNTMFPSGAPNTAKVSLSLMGEAGVKPQARRAFGDALLDRAKTESKALEDQRFVNPRTVSRYIEDMRETVPTVLGQNTAEQFGNLNQVGRAITRDEILNPSGTARALEALQAAGGAGTAVYGIVDPKENESRLTPLAKYAALTVAAPYLTARAFSNPNFARRLTLPPKPVSLQLGGTGAGLAGRLAAQNTKSDSGPAASAAPAEEWKPGDPIPGSAPDEWKPGDPIPR